MPRFVLLYHDCPPSCPRPSHWDFMLEEGDSLRTWALESLPNSWRGAQLRTAQTHPQCSSVAGSDDVAARELDRHRHAYLDYEGEVSNGRGHVIRIAAGTYTSDSETPNAWRLTLAGDAIAGPIELRRVAVGEPSWMLACGQPG